MHIPNNTAIRLWTNLLGYQKGTYTSIFPSREQSKKILNTGDAIFVERKRQSYQITTIVQVVQMDTIDYYPVWFDSNNTSGKVIKNTG